MPISYLRYDLQDGFIDNWLVGGPQTIPIRDLVQFTDEDYKGQIFRYFHEEDSGIKRMPVEQGPLTQGIFKVGDYQGVWSYIHCREDHFVDLSVYYPTCHYLRSWAYAQVWCKRPQQVTLSLATFGPADVWLNGEHVHRQEHISADDLQRVPFEAEFHNGPNKLLIRFEAVAVRDCPYGIALQVSQRAQVGSDGAEITSSPDPLSEMWVRLPTTIENVARRNTLEKVFDAAYIDRDVYARDDKIIVSWPKDMPIEAITSVRFQTPSGRIYAESSDKGSPGDTAFLSFSHQVAEGPYQALLMPGPKEYYEGNRRITRRLDFWCVGNNPCSEAPYGAFEERRQEALNHAARRENDLFAEIARIALNRWESVETGIILRAIESVNQRRDGSDVCLLGLLGMFYRFRERPQFPMTLRQPLEDCILDFKYWQDEPGSDVMCCADESHCILFHACEILAGQLFPDRLFNNNGESGQRHREKGEKLALAWLDQHSAYGFEDWNSDEGYAEILIALSHLVDLAESERIYELAAVLMDKLFFTIALNSYKGVFGSAHGRSRALSVMAGSAEATAGITRLMWGLGSFNHHLAGTVSLACMQDYELPTILSDLAVNLPEEMWSRERNVFSSSAMRSKDGNEVNAVTYKTPDYMLSSAQDYLPGEKGDREHIWQATLGPAAVVFVNHPACSMSRDPRRPNFWLGNRSLPRVAQWKDALIAIYKLPEDDWMGFTHAYFPTHAFDEYLLQDGWAFARKGGGYLALTSSQGFKFVQEGHSAYRELRSHGRENVWLCQMGRAARDGDFNNFKEKVLASKKVFMGLQAQYCSVRGDTLDFGWREPFYVNQVEQPLAGFKHYENLYCVTELPCRQMEIHYGDYLLRLNFSYLLGGVSESSKSLS